MNTSKANSLATGNAVLFFYTQFAVPSRDLYSWNRSKGLDRDEFLGGTLGLYFGKGSEYAALARENPNLNFDVEQVPQGSDATVLRNYGDFYAFAIPRASTNSAGAYALALYLSEPAHATKIASAYNLAPVQRSVLGGGSTDSVKNVLYRSALISRGWLDPKPSETSRLFREMIEEVVANNSQRYGDIVDDIIYQIESLF
jgi:ABC-type glycerol-3-phosphate transport system substrate-binding protein